MDPNNTKRRARTPPLPPELLLCIFHYATHVPGTLIPDIYDNASILGPIFIEKFQPALREALVTKYALARVCKQWWYLAAPILYTSVYIGSVRCISSLCSTLERSIKDKGKVVGMRPLGDYTQRLDIAIRDCAEDSDAEDSDAEDSDAEDVDTEDTDAEDTDTEDSDAKDTDADYDLLKIINHMRHLAIFSIAVNPDYADPRLPYTVLNALRLTKHTLRVFDWSSPNLELPISQTRWLLDDCTQLRVLNCPGVPLSVETKQVAIPPTVTTLRLRTLIRVRSTPTPNWNLYIDRKPLPPPIPLPVLQEFILDFSGEECNCSYVFNTYGSQLVSVHLYKPGEFEDEVCPALNLLARKCPNLSRLTITSNNFTGFFDNMPDYESGSESGSGSDSDSVEVSAPITNTYLGLRVYYSSKPDFRALFGFLEYVRPRMPSLQVVQLLNESYVWCLLWKHPEFAMRALRRFMKADAPVRLEDKDGVLLTDRLRALGHI